MLSKKQEEISKKYIEIYNQNYGAALKEFSDEKLKSWKIHTTQVDNAVVWSDLLLNGKHHLVVKSDCQVGKTGATLATCNILFNTLKEQNKKLYILYALCSNSSDLEQQTKGRIKAITNVYKFGKSGDKSVVYLNDGEEDSSCKTNICFEKFGTRNEKNKLEIGDFDISNPDHYLLVILDEAHLAQKTDSTLVDFLRNKVGLEWCKPIEKNERVFSLCLSATDFARSVLVESVGTNPDDYLKYFTEVKFITDENLYYGGRKLLLDHEKEENVTSFDLSKHRNVYRQYKKLLNKVTRGKNLNTVEQKTKMALEDQLYTIHENFLDSCLVYLKTSFITRVPAPKKQALIRIRCESSSWFSIIELLVIKWRRKNNIHGKIFKYLSNNKNFLPLDKLKAYDDFEHIDNMFNERFYDAPEAINFALYCEALGVGSTIEMDNTIGSSERVLSEETSAMAEQYQEIGRHFGYGRSIKYPIAFDVEMVKKHVDYLENNKNGCAGAGNKIKLQAAKQKSIYNLEYFVFNSQDERKTYSIDTGIGQGENRTNGWQTGDEGNDPCHWILNDGIGPENNRQHWIHLNGPGLNSNSWDKVMAKINNKEICFKDINQNDVWPFNNDGSLKDLVYVNRGNRTAITVPSQSINVLDKKLGYM